MQEIRKFPMLEPNQEYMLAKSYLEHDDRDAAHKLVTSHLRLVAKIAMGYRGYGLPIGEVVSEGNTTANQKRLFFNLRKAKSRIQALDDGDLNPDQVQQIATQLGVSEEEVTSMNRRMAGDASLNAPIKAAEGESGEWQDWLEDESESAEQILVKQDELESRREMLADAMSVLNEREQRIFMARRLEESPITLEELSGEFDISRERVRQIEVRAFEKVQKAMVASAKELAKPNPQLKEFSDDPACCCIASPKDPCP